ncbi:MAG: hypothetical protein KF788_08065 [Piscinibacter sp.]|nr:hypothetical protein [Piscinibacter sp.]
MSRTLATLALALASTIVGLPAQAQSFIQVRDWDVYVDLPTRFAYVKAPDRWVFVRQLDEEQMTRLPATTLTALLPPEQPEIRWAHPAMEESPRMLALRTTQTRFAGRAAPNLTQ